MKPLRRREEFVYMDVEMKMSNKALADVMYAAIICQAIFTTIWSMTAHEYTRAQNFRNEVSLKVNIHPDEVQRFNDISGQVLRVPPKITIN